MTGKSNEDGFDEDVVKIIDGLVNVGSNESAEDYLEQSNEQLQFKKDSRLDITNRPLIAEEGNRIITEGSSGVIFECSDKEFERTYALKIQRPSLFAEKEKSMSEIKEELKSNRAEAMKQGQLSQDNVAYLVWAEQWSMPGTAVRPDVTVMVQEWIEGGKPLDEYVHSENVEEIDSLVRILRDFFRGLSHVHEKDLIHWDIKAENCLVDESTGTAKITDVGNAREKRSPGTYDESVTRFTSRKCWPEDTGDYVDEYEGSNRIRIQREENDRRFDRPWLDLYMAGRMLARICGIEQEVGLVGSDDNSSEDRGTSLKPDVLKGHDDHTVMVRDFLILIVKRLLKPFEDGVEGEHPSYYESAAESEEEPASKVKQDLEKLLHKFGDAEGVPELYPIPQHVLRIPISGNTVFSERIDSLVNLEPGMRLAGHEQLGLTRFVFPGARHSRFEHSVGVIGATLQYIRALYADQSNPMFRLLCDSRHIRALVFAAAVHDMGHGAFSHYLEENRSLFSGCSHEEYIQAVLRNNLDYYSGYDSDDPIDDCHILSDRTKLKSEVKENWVINDPPYDEDPDDFMRLVADILNPHGASHAGDQVVSNDILRADPTDWEDTKEATIWVLHSVIDSVLDADKFDYLQRDAEHTGVDYSEGVDLDRFLQNLTVAPHPPDGNRSGFYPTIAVNKKGVSSLESLLLARYQVFKSVYWHQIARSATTLLKDAVKKYLFETDSLRTFEKRRARLLHEFREQDDEIALDWLFKQLSEAELNGAAYRKSLTRREGLPKPIFDISQGEPSFERDTDYPEGCDRIININNKILKREPEHFYYIWNELREHVAEEINERIQDYCETGPGTKSPPEIDSESIFIDVPPKGKDQIKNLYVVDRSGRRHLRGEALNGEQNCLSGVIRYNIQPFDEYSSMADEIQYAFEHWGRRIRVFASQDKKEHIVEAVNHREEKTKELVFESLLAGYEKVNEKLL